MKAHGATLRAPRDARLELGFARALNAGDLDAAAGCFTRDACLITPDTTAIHGRDSIRPVLAQLVAREVEIEVEASDVLGGGGVLLAYERWRLSSGAAGDRLAQTLYPVLLLRQIEGTWKLAIAAPWGWADRHR